MTEVSLAELGPSLQQLLDESQRLRKDVKSAEQARRRENRIGLFIIGLLTLFVVLIGVVTWQSNQVVRSTQQTNDVIVDCTTPGGQCYEDGRRRTGAAVADLIRASTYVAQCARLRPNESGPEFDRFLEQCVAEKLGAGPTPHPSISPSPTGS